jgi:hypothetical protein
MNTVEDDSASTKGLTRDFQANVRILETMDEMAQGDRGRFRRNNCMLMGRPEAGWSGYHERGRDVKTRPLVVASMWKIPA